MEKYETLELQVIAFEVDDVLENVNGVDVGSRQATANDRV